MNKVALTDGSGQWFDSDKAERFTEAKYWDGNNHISKATGSQWKHEALYLTAGKRWILNHWSEYSGSREVYREISKEEAAVWFSKQVLDPHESLETLVNNLEIE